MPAIDFYAPGTDLTVYNVGGSGIGFYGGGFGFSVQVALTTTVPESYEFILHINTEGWSSVRGWIIYNPHERILQIKEHHKNRLAEISSVIKDNPITAYKLSQIHFGEDLDEMNSYMALSEVLGHLLYLQAQDKVKKIEKNGKFLYYC